MGIQTAVETGLVAKLTATAGTVLWAGRVYNLQAPKGAALPYVVFFHVAGGDQNISPSRIVEVIYQVECWSERQADAMTGADYLEAALHNQHISVSGFTLTGPVEATRLRAGAENFEGVQRWRRGADYRIQLCVP